MHKMETPPCWRGSPLFWVFVGFPNATNRGRPAAAAPVSGSGLLSTTAPQHLVEVQALVDAQAGVAQTRQPFPQRLDLPVPLVFTSDGYSTVVGRVSTDVSSTTY